MPTTGLHHFTIRCAPDDLPEIVAFYGRYLNLTPGPRPVMPAPGFWLYAGDQPVVHLYASLPHRDTAGTGPLDHISFRGEGLEATRAFLRADGIPFDDLPVPGWPLQQLFLRDPNGLKIEMTFDLDQEGGQADGAHA